MIEGEINTCERCHQPYINKIDVKGHKCCAFCYTMFVKIPRREQTLKMPQPCPF